YYNSQVRKIIGGVDQGLVIDFRSYANTSLNHYLKIFENGIGYCMYSRRDLFGLKIYKTTNFGDNWASVYDNFQNSYEIVLSDLDISKTNPNQVCIFRADVGVPKNLHE
ncbi:MAG: hypothetical protein KDD00_13055, partial [Ignavibacteriae bacterium]|nr:hypothetical protein [Ignavibacteriota bacterium]